VLRHDLPLKTADGVTSLARIGAGTAIRRCSFHACGRVLIKSPNPVVEACQFTNGIALQAGSDIGFGLNPGSPTISRSGTTISPTVSLAPTN
jgi:hypothetical protein